MGKDAVADIKQEDGFKESMKTPDANHLTTQSPDADLTTQSPDADLTTQSPDADLTTQSPDADLTTQSPEPNPTHEPSREDDDSDLRPKRKKSRWTDTPRKDSGFTQKSTVEIQADLMAAQQKLMAAQTAQCAQQKNRIYIGSLDFSLDEPDMKDVFTAFGEILNIDMPKEGNRSKGYCFIEYKNAESAEMALQTMQNFVLKGRVIKVGRPTSSTQTQAQALLAAGLPPNALMNGGMLSCVNGVPALSPSTIAAGNQDMNRIYIGNVPYSFTAEDIRKIFAVFGTILSCQLIPSAENPGTHRGYGFLEFSTNAEAKSAIETMNGFEVQGKQLKVNYSTQLHTRPVSSQAPASPGVVVAPVGDQFTGVMGGSITGSNLSPLGGGLTGYERPSSLGSVGSPGVLSANVQAPVTSSPVILMTNMINPSEIDREFPKEVKTEASKYGEVEDVRIQIVTNEVRVFIKFTNASSACSAVPSLNGRWFSGRLIKCKLYNQELYEGGHYEL
eukprot:GHVH01002650.1.p1 GENE.GHVH01002650.1~~GHVH01002650.1.p1  ORF type:complete len:527 (+),score=58.16 GHVH01002650.1:73-1581(+)